MAPLAILSLACKDGLAIAPELPAIRKFRGSRVEMSELPTVHPEQHQHTERQTSKLQKTGPFRRYAGSLSSCPTTQQRNLKKDSVTLALLPVSCPVSAR